MDRLSTDEEFALPTFVNRIYDKELDFSNKEKIVYSFTLLGMGYFCYLSAKFYLTLGGQGTQYLPIGTFSEKFGGEAAFWCNASLNWYFIKDTMFTIRKDYYQYQIVKKLGVAPPLWKLILKRGIAITFALTTGVVFSIIAYRIQNSLYNAVVTGIINILLSYLGFIALQDVFIYCYTKFIEKFLPKYYEKRGIKNTTQKSANWFPTYLESKKDELQALPNTKFKNDFLKTPYGYQRFVIQNQRSAFLPHTPKKNSMLSILRNTIFFGTHINMQIFNMISYVGYLAYTIQSMKDLFDIENSGSNIMLGTIMFVPLYFLSIDVLIGTVNDIISLTKTAVIDIAAFIKNPQWSRETFTKLSFIIPGTLLAIFGYFISYVSSNTSLELNADYVDWDDWWNVYPTCISSLAFNGFGILKTILEAAKKFQSCRLYSPEKRKVLHYYEQTCSFFKAYPESLNRYVKNSRPCSSVKLT